MSTNLTRRQLGKLALAAAATSAVSVAPAEAAMKPEQTFQALHSFPEGFLWGTATASYQVEGAAKVDGRGVSIWDTFSHTPGKTHDDTGDVADDEFHRYKDDVALLRDLGVKTYRFSVAWPRVFATGEGRPNERGLAYYERLVDELKKSGIEPYCTLYHWDLPQTLQDKGGWQNADTAKRFAEYAGYVSGRLSQRGVSHFMTTNEIRTFVELGYKTGTHAPGLKLGRREIAQVAHHAVLAHGLGVQAIRANAKAGSLVGLAENPTATVPAVNDAATRAAAEMAFREENAPYLTAVMEGRYTERYLQTMGAEAPRFTDAEMLAIGSKLDFVGLNIYQPTYVMAANDAKGYTIVEPSTTYPRMLSPWLTIGPECLYWAPVHATKLWKLPAIYITENGASATDAMTAGGEVLDIDRVMYLRNYLSQLQKAVSEGAPVKGYFVWSLLDNYEWNDGYGKRFGLVYVDFVTQKRTPKLSAKFYEEVIRRNEVV